MKLCAIMSSSPTAHCHAPRPTPQPAFAPGGTSSSLRASGGSGGSGSGQGNAPAWERVRCGVQPGTTTQLIVKSAFCYCADNDINKFDAGTQSAIKGVMIQKLKTTGNTNVTNAGDFCNYATEPEECIQAECQGTPACPSVRLTVLCGTPF